MLDGHFPRLNPTQDFTNGDPPAFRRANPNGRARKACTSPTSRNFSTTIVGPTHIGKGWVLYADDRQMVVDGGAKSLIDVPQADAGIDLDEGALAVNNRVNVTLFPG